MLKKAFFPIILTFIFLASCSDSADKAVSQVKLPQSTQAIITFTTGEVQKMKDNQWSPAEINDFIETGDTVKVESDSFCEIQFGNRAVIKIEENTELVFPSIDTSAGQSNVALDLITGSVLSKVNKLAGSESFEVKTKSAACGVRGTEFMVKSGSTDNTLLAVREGAVAFTPASFKLDELLAGIPDADKEAAEAVEKIRKSLVIVKKDQEIEISSENIARINNIYKDLENAVSELKQDDIKKLSENIVRQIVLSTALSEVHRSEMDDLDAMIIRELPDQDGGKKGTTGELLKVSVSVNIPDAQIIREKRVIGKGSFSAIFSNGETISLLIRKKGYYEKTLEFTVQKELENRYDVILEKDPDAKESVTVSINVLPPDAEIIIDNITEASGTLEREFLTEKTYNVLVKKDGFQKKSFSISQPKENDNINIKLLPSIEKRIKVSNGRLTGYTAFSGGKVFAADSYGEVIAADVKGNILWKQQTGNTPNERAFPVIHNDKLYFSGANEFLVIACGTGEVISSFFLDDDTSHVFGRRVVMAGDTGIYPANTNLFRFDQETGEFTEEIAIPDGTRMTPGINGNEILIVNQKGVFFRIDSDTGEIKSSIPTQAVQPVVNNVAVAEGKAFFNGKNGDIVCINLSDNKIVWIKSIAEGKSRMITGDLKYENGGIYAFSDNQIFAFSSKDGGKLFNSVKNVTSPPVLYGGKLYYCTSDGLFKTADSRTGTVLEFIDIKARVTSAPFYDNGRIFAGTDSGEILVLNP